MVECFTFDDNQLLPNRGDHDKVISEAEIDQMNMWLYLKDKFNISNEAWREISIASDVCSSMVDHLRLWRFHAMLHSIC